MDFAVPRYIPILEEQHNNMIPNTINRIPHHGKVFKDVGDGVGVAVFGVSTVPDPPVGVEFVSVFVVLLVVGLVTLHVCVNPETSITLESVTLTDRL